MTHKRRDESCKTFRETDSGFKAPTQEQKQMGWSNKDQTMQKSKDDNILQYNFQDSFPHLNLDGDDLPSVFGKKKSECLLPDV